MSVLGAFRNIEASRDMSQGKVVRYFQIYHPQLNSVLFGQSELDQLITTEVKLKKQL